MEIREIKTELDFQRGKIIARKLRKNPDAVLERKKLKEMLYEYEKRVWHDYEAVSDKQVRESEEAVAQAELELL